MSEQIKTEQVENTEASGLLLSVEPLEKAVTLHATDDTDAGADSGDSDTSDSVGGDSDGSDTSDADGTDGGGGDSDATDGGDADGTDIIGDNADGTDAAADADGTDSK
ncbi:MAG TPA: hypothetical protein VGC91_01025 [Pyrinomonadaceae bacterium]|jgi:hypothetical protein